MSYKGETKFMVDGQEHILVITHDALDSMETRFKVKFSELGKIFDGGLSMKDLGFMFHEGLREYHKDIDPKGASRIISKLGVMVAQNMVLAGILAHLEDGEVAEGGVSDPPTESLGVSPTA